MINASKFSTGETEYELKSNAQLHQSALQENGLKNKKSSY